MSDDEFIYFAGFDGKHLPLLVLRKDTDFYSFLKRYLTAFDCEENIFETEDLVDFCQDDEFNEWLENQNHNNKFLAYLIDKKMLEDFKYESIFLDSNNKLYSADEIYGDIDAELKDLSAFSEFLPHLSLHTRKFFADNEAWTNATNDIFDKFDADYFVNEILLSDNNKEDVIQILKNKDNSLHFYKFLAERVGFSQEYKKLPFIDAENNIIENFNDSLIYFNSQEGYKVKKQYG